MTCYRVHVLLANHRYRTVWVTAASIAEAMTRVPVIGRDMLVEVVAVVPAHPFGAIHPGESALVAA
jgi:hypothetical protein